MKKDINIPAIPTNNVRFEDGTLRFNIPSGCAYSTSDNHFVGGEWIGTHFRTPDGEPAWVKLEGNVLIIEKLINFLVDSKTGYFVGGEKIEIARLQIIPNN